ncbi:hypothetical protein EYV94_10510 [Puteibacter caeruleilacunae]|nr:hypothetical protein EYV94_10510 [Puteibacter caeruleilacunae]
MARIVLLIAIALLNIDVTAQVAGLGEKDLTFSFSTNESRVELVLNKNSVFDYYIKAPFVRKATSGKWKVIDNALILNSFNSENEVKQKVVENYNPEVSKRKCSFDVTNMKGKHLTFDIRVLYAKEADEQVHNGLSSPVIFEVKQGVNGFIIESVFSHVEYYITDKKANDFTVQLNDKFIFQNEKWLFYQGKIRPRNFNGKPTKYYLTVE